MPSEPLQRTYLRIRPASGDGLNLPDKRFLEGWVNNTMTIVAAIVAVLLLGYLVVALVRPEKF